MKIVKRSLLWLLTAAVPVVIAACYGVMTNYKKVQVINSADKAPISGIQVRCDHIVLEDGGAGSEDGGSASEDAGIEGNVFTTDSEGRATIEYSIFCDSLSFTDVDGAENGQFDSKTIDFVEGDDEEVVELAPSAG
jgi:hypothetical protein